MYHPMGRIKECYVSSFIPPLCNGSISDFDSESVGSSPAGGAIWEFRLTGKAAFRHCLDVRQRQQIFSFAFGARVSRFESSDSHQY